MFVNTNGPLPGMDLSFPDVFLLPTPVGPIPTPFVNMGLRPTEIPTCVNILVMCLPVHNLMNQTPVSVAGPGPGIASGMVCGPDHSLLGSFKTFFRGMPATRALVDPTMNNGMSPNSVGITVAPSQIRMLVLS